MPGYRTAVKRCSPGLTPAWFAFFASGWEPFAAHRIFQSLNFASYHESALSKLFVGDVEDEFIAQHVPLRTLLRNHPVLRSLAGPRHRATASREAPGRARGVGQSTSIILAEGVPHPDPLPASAGRGRSTDATADLGGRTTVTVQAASAATLAETLPSSVRTSEFCRAPITMWST